MPWYTKTERLHTPKYRHGSHTTPIDTDMIAVLFGPFGDLHRSDKRMPYVNEGYVDMNPSDTKELGIHDGDYVWIDPDQEDCPFRGWKENARDYAYRISARRSLTAASESTTSLPVTWRTSPTCAAGTSTSSGTT